MHFDPIALVLRLAVMIVSLSFHEFAHAFFATRFGDPTPREQGRLTLNPVRHVDPIGTLLLPAISAATGVPLIGWARPVQVSPSRFRRGVNTRVAMMIVSVAGPLTNLLLAFVSAALLAFVVPANAQLANDVLQMAFLMNVGLFIFNLLPLPPLDGSRLLPRSLDGFQRGIAPYSMIILTLVLMIPMLNQWLLAYPVRFITRLIGGVFGLVTL